MHVWGETLFVPFAGDRPTQRADGYFVPTATPSQWHALIEARVYVGEKAKWESHHAATHRDLAVCTSLNDPGSCDVVRGNPRYPSEVAVDAVWRVGGADEPEATLYSVDGTHPCTCVTIPLISGDVSASECRSTTDVKPPASMLGGVLYETVRVWPCGGGSSGAQRRRSIVPTAKPLERALSEVSCDDDAMADFLTIWNDHRRYATPCDGGWTTCPGVGHLSGTSAYGIVNGALIHAIADFPDQGECQEREPATPTTCPLPTDACGSLDGFQLSDEDQQWWATNDGGFLLVDLSGGYAQVDKPRKIAVYASGSTTPVRTEEITVDDILGVSVASDIPDLARWAPSKTLWLELPELDPADQPDEKAPDKLLAHCTRHVESGATSKAMAACFRGLIEGGSAKTRAALLRAWSQLEDAQGNKTRAQALRTRAARL